jgi:hypothetical protein
LSDEVQWGAGADSSPTCGFILLVLKSAQRGIFCPFPLLIGMLVRSQAVLVAVRALFRFGAVFQLRTTCAAHWSFAIVPGLAST